MAEATGTHYVVLSETNDHTWAVQSMVTARSGEEAIRKVADKIIEGKGTFRAVPERSWRTVVKVRAERVVQHKYEVGSEYGAYPTDGDNK